MESREITARQLIPHNWQGKATDLLYSNTAANETLAATIFTIAAERLCTPCLWHKLAGVLSAAVTHFNSSQEQVIHPVEVGDFLRIDIPGPGPSEGDGYDWVKVDMLEKVSQACCGLRLRACANPFSDTITTAHFFTADATSTLLIERTGLTVTAGYYGRNEMPNSKDLPVRDKPRNLLVATGAMAGLSELQWNALIKSFLTN
jgi:hypothetical protein